MRWLALALGVVVLVAVPATPARADPDDLELPRSYPLDRRLDPSWRREHLPELIERANRKVRQRAAAELRRKRKRKTGVVAPTPTPPPPPSPPPHAPP